MKDHLDTQSFRNSYDQSSLSSYGSSILTPTCKESVSVKNSEIRKEEFVPQNHKYYPTVSIDGCSGIDVHVGDKNIICQGPIYVRQILYPNENQLEDNSVDNYGFVDNIGDYIDKQYIQATSRKGQEFENNKVQSKPQEVFRKCLNRKSTKYLIALFLLSGVISAGCIFYFWKDISAEDDVPVTLDEYIDNVGEKIHIISKKDWSGRPALSETRFLKPPEMVIIRHTAESSCNNFQTCARKVRDLQAFQMGDANQFTDIAYNFLIGGDGNVYVGRGPDIQNAWESNAMEVCYIGNFVFDVMTEKMESAGKQLLQQLMDTNKISKNYKLFAHNHTYNTLSPGENVYKKIKKWPHFSYELCFSSCKK